MTHSLDTKTPNPTITRPARSQGALRVTNARVLLSEWTKFRSLRSTIYTVVVAVALMVGLGALFSAITASQYTSFDPAAKAQFNPISTSLAGVLFAQLAIGVLGVLLISGEYSTGMIRSSLTVVPRRLPMLAAKIVVFASAVFVTMSITSLGSFLLGQALLGSSDLGVSLGSPGALRSVLGAALYLTVAGVIGVALGALLRNTAAGISTFVGAFFVIPPLTGLLPASWTDKFVQYLPSNAGGVLYGGTRGLTNALAPWTGFAVLCGYAVFLVGLAMLQMRRKDA